MSEASSKKPMLLLTHLQFPTEYGLFLAVNMLDLVMTMLFIERGGGEANPLANWILLAGGKTGFIVYKVALVLLVIALCEVVARKRRLAARLLVAFGILSVGIIAVSSIVRYCRGM